MLTKTQEEQLVRTVCALLQQHPGNRVAVSKKTINRVMGQVLVFEELPSGGFSLRTMPRKTAQDYVRRRQDKDHKRRQETWRKYLDGMMEPKAEEPVDPSSTEEDTEP